MALEDHHEARAEDRLIEGQMGKIATIREQRRRIAWTGGGGRLAGIPQIRRR